MDLQDDIQPHKREWTHTCMRTVKTNCSHKRTVRWDPPNQRRVVVAMSPLQVTSQRGNRSDRLPKSPPFSSDQTTLPVVCSNTRNPNGPTGKLRCMGPVQELTCVGYWVQTTAVLSLVAEAAIVIDHNRKHYSRNSVIELSPSGAKKFLRSFPKKEFMHPFPVR